MAVGHDGLLHELLGLLGNLFPGCPAAQRAFSTGALLQRTLDLICKPGLDVPTLQVAPCCPSVLSNWGAAGPHASDASIHLTPLFWSHACAPVVLM